MTDPIIDTLRDLSNENPTDPLAMVSLHAATAAVREARTTTAREIEKALREQGRLHVEWRKAAADFVAARFPARDNT